MKVLRDIWAGITRWRSWTSQDPVPRIEDAQSFDVPGSADGALEPKDLVGYALQLNRDMDALLAVATSRAYNMLRVNIALTAAMLALTRWWTAQEPSGLVRVTGYGLLALTLYLTVKGAIHAHLAVASRPIAGFAPDFVDNAQALLRDASSAARVTLQVLEDARRFHWFNDYHRSIRTEHANLALNTSLLHFLVATAAAGTMLLTPPPSADSDRLGHGTCTTSHRTGTTTQPASVARGLP